MKRTVTIAAVLVMLLLTAATCEKAADKDCSETVKTDCMCTMQYDPVCGCNKKTYGNACEAECHGIMTYTKGECPK